MYITDKEIQYNQYIKRKFKSSFCFLIDITKLQFENN